MKMICDRTLLSNAVAGVSKAVTQRSSIPVLEGILMKAEGFSLTLTGYDLEMGITTSIEANVLEPGEVVLSAKLLGDMVRRLSSSEVEITATETNATTIKGGITEFDIMGMNPGDFPELPSPGADHTLDLETPTFREMVETTLFAVSQDDKKPAHTGELFAIEPDKLTVVALDGYRLAIIEKPVKAAKDINIIIPAKTLAEAIKLFTDDDEVVHIAANRRFVVFSSRTYTVISRLIEGDFLDYKRVIPEGYHTRVTVDVRDFSNSIERASLIITERLKNPLRITFDGNITVRCQTTLGKVVDELDAEIEGEPVEIGFNNRYLLDAALCQLYPGYVTLLRRYSRLVTQKNALLKSYWQTPDANGLLDVFDEKLAESGAAVSAKRQEYLALIEPEITGTYRDIASGSETLAIQYEPSFEPEKGLAPVLRESRARDIAAGFCTAGPHREDFSISIDGRAAKVFASQGQQRSAVLSLKLAEAAGAQKITGEHPVMLLDDVLSELDETRQSYLLSRMEHRQTIVTACDPDLFRRTSGRVYRMEGGILHAL